ncbi:hypothetical protein SRHO_G00288970 [Serrasalmus rhombeus]
MSKKQAQLWMSKPSLEQNTILTANTATQSELLASQHALNAIISFEWLILPHIKASILTTLDQYQFAYKAKRSTEKLKVQK